MTYNSNSEYFELINPVVSSAKGSLDLLEAAGVAEAAEMKELLKVSVSQELSEAQKKNPALLGALSAIYELRYSSINYYVEKVGIKNIIDLGCGYSPRAVRYLKKTDCKYIGVDLPAVINDVRKINGNIDYQAADITNGPALKKIISKLDGKILIITENVLPYLTLSELKMVITVIRDLFAEKPGIWITADFKDADYASAVLKASVDEAVYGTLVQNAKKNKVGAEFRDGVPACVSAGAGLLSENGFVEKQVPFFNDQMFAFSLVSLPFGVKQKIFENYKQFVMSAYFLNGNEEILKENKSEPTTQSTGGFSFQCKTVGDVITILLKGRLDTVTAPDFLAYYEKYCDPAKAIVLDCTDLEYVSSAGLRVFLMMYKKSNAKVKIVNANEMVTEVLDQTGMGEFFLGH